MSKRESICPLCGARMTVADVLDACEGVSSFQLGLLAGCCPHCQGRLEMRPGKDRIEIGYTFGSAELRFEVASTLPCAGLVLEAFDDPLGLALHLDGRTWRFVEID